MYKLKTKSGEVIAKCEASTLRNAQIYFSIRKNIELEELLKIYIVE